jgi:hypothetical protein
MMEALLYVNSVLDFKEYVGLCSPLTRRMDRALVKGYIIAQRLNPPDQLTQ